MLFGGKVPACGLSEIVRRYDLVDDDGTVGQYSIHNSPYYDNILSPFLSEM
jgi:hypothetical protein